MKYKHIITIAYPATNEGSLVMHFSIIDESPAQYSRADLINIYLCNEIPGQEIWGTYYQHNNFIFPIFYCKKELGETKMLLKGQSATTGQEYFELDGWNINDPVVSYTSTVEEI